MASCPATQFSILLPGCMGLLAGCPASNPLWGMRPACQQRAQCFSGQRWRLESEADPATLQAKGEKWEGRRAKGSKGERVVFLGFSQIGNVAETVFCNSHRHLGQTEWANYVYQPQHINTGTKEQKPSNVREFFFTSGHEWSSPDANNIF